MNGLITHCGAETMSRDELYKVPTPKGTDTHVPIPHGLLVDFIERELFTLGYGVTGFGAGCTKDGMNAFGVLQIARLCDAGNVSLPIDYHDDYSLMVGWRNSNNKKFPAQLAIGNRVFVCDNMAFVGEEMIGRRHTKYILDNLDERIRIGLTKVIGFRAEMDTRIAHLKEVDITKAETRDLIIDSFEAGIVPGRSLGQLIKECNAPRHVEFRDGNAWGVYNCFTETLKASPSNLTERTMGLTRMFDERFGKSADEYEIRQTLLAV